MYGTLERDLAARLDPAGQRLTRMGYTGHLEKSSEPAPILANSGSGLIAEAVRDMRAIYVPDVCSDPRYLNGDPRTWSELAVPLPGPEGALGALNTESHLPDAFDERQQRVMAAFAERPCGPFFVTSSRRAPVRAASVSAARVITSDALGLPLSSTAMRRPASDAGDGARCTTSGPGSLSGR